MSRSVPWVGCAVTAGSASLYAERDPFLSDERRPHTEVMTVVTDPSAGLLREDLGVTVRHLVELGEEGGGVGVVAVSSVT